MNTINATIPAAYLRWVDAAIATGVTTDLITRKQALKIKRDTGARLPRWLMKDPSRRRGRGAYSCPEITERIKELEAAKTKQPAAMAFRGKSIPQIARMALRGKNTIATKIKRRK
jgi:hypothetical protein